MHGSGTIAVAIVAASALGAETWKRSLGKADNLAGADLDAQLAANRRCQPS